MRKLLCIFSVAATLTAAAPNFLTPHSYPVSGMAYVVTGDFNGDGKLDVAVSGYDDSGATTSDLQIMLGNAKGAFTALPSIAPGNGPLALAAADFNGDGKLDLAVANWSSNTVSVLLGNGDGTFQTPINLAVTAPIALAVGDINGDGHLDLVVGTYSSEQIVIFAGNGTGKFRQVQSISPGYVLSQVALADLNHDGKLDLIYSGQPGPGIVTQLGLGNGQFGSPVTFGPNAIAFALADLNGDGNIDVAASYGGNIQIGLGNGDGTFSSGASIVLPFIPYEFLAAGEFITVGDFNEDGHLDLAIGLQNNTGPQNLAILFGAGDGTFPTQSMLAGECACAIATGDFNGDNHLDLALGNLEGGSFAVALGNGHGSFPAPITPNDGTPPVRGMAAADFNQDGKMDLVTTTAPNSKGQVNVLFGNGNGTFQAPATIRVGFEPNGVAVADLNHDGILDLAVADSEPDVGGVWVVLGRPGGKFASPVEYSLAVDAVAVAIGDLNGDGFPDLMVVAGDGRRETAGLVVLLGNGDGTFGDSQTFSAGANPAAIVTGDFNGDGKLDAAIADAGGQLLLLLGNGDGTFASPVTLAFCNSPLSVVAADFNKDGHLDLATGCEAEYEALVLLGNGNGTFQTPVSYALGFPQGLVAADVNGDGITDLVATTGTPSAFTVLTGKGDGTFQNSGSFDSPLGPMGILSADFNNDGKPDLAIFGGLQVDAVGAVTVSVFLNTTR